jgi:hypothetical protein
MPPAHIPLPYGAIQTRIKIMKSQNQSPKSSGVPRRLMVFFSTSPAQWLELCLVVGVLLAVFCAGIQGVSFHPDESQWIATSQVFEAFLTGDFSSPLWEESHWTLTQPPVTRYIIGGGRRAGGYRWADLNVAWSWQMDTEANIARDAMPSPGLLWWSRLSMAILAVVCGLILFKLVRAFAGRLAGYIMLLLFVASPYLSYNLGRAMSEAPMLAFVLLAIFAGAQALNSWQRAAADDVKSVRAFVRPLGWVIVMSVLCGLAGATKLNGLLTVPAALMLCVLAPVAQKGDVPASTRACFMIVACVLVLLVAVGTFVALNPYLYPDVWGHTVNMFQYRLQEMQTQEAAFPTYRIQGLDMRIRIVSQRVFQDYATLYCGGAQIVNIPLCGLGLCYLLYAAWRWLRGRAILGTSMAIILVGVTTAVPALLTPLDWDRYFLLPVVFSSLCIAIGISWAIRGAYGWVRHRIVHEQLSKPDEGAKAEAG